MASTHAADVSGEPGRAAAAARQLECGAQAGLYRLLGRCLEAEVDNALLNVLRTRLREPLVEAGLSFDDVVHALRLESSIVAAIEPELESAAAMQ